MAKDYNTPLTAEQVKALVEKQKRSSPYYDYFKNRNKNNPV